MAIQQMGLLAYRAGQSGGADSAYLQNIYESSSGTVSFTFNPTFYGVGYVFGDVSLASFQWKTGPNAANQYQVKYIEEVAGLIGINDSGYAQSGVWYNLGDLDSPRYQLDGGIGAWSDGWMVIRNVNNPSVELANVSASFSADPNT